MAKRHDGQRSIRHTPIEHIGIWDISCGTSQAKRATQQEASDIAKSTRQMFLTRVLPLQYLSPSRRRITRRMEDNIATAREFISSELGFAEHIPVYRMRDKHTHIGSHYRENDTVDFCDPKTLTPRQRVIGRTAILVHELAHASADNFRTTYFTSRNHHDRLELVGNYTSLGMVTFKLLEGGQLEPHGDYFEEGFAEYQACQWRKQNISGLANPDQTVMLPGDHEAPAYYSIPSDHATTEIDENAISMESALATLGIQKLSDHLGIDLFEILQRARQRETEVQAKREFAQLVNSVQPGLYRTLRDLHYLEGDDFERSIDIIDDAIHSHIILRNYNANRSY